MKRSTVIILIMSIIVVGAVAVWRLVPRQLAAEECSDVYRHFAEMQLPDVRVTFIQNKRINDTLRLPVTLLEAETDAGWDLLDSLFGRKQQNEAMMNDPTIPDEVKRLWQNTEYDVFFYRAHRETPLTTIEAGSARPSDVTVQMLPHNRCAMIIEPLSRKEEKALIQSAINENARLEEERALHERSYDAIIDAQLDYVDSLDAERNKQ